MQLSLEELCTILQVDARSQEVFEPKSIYINGAAYDSRQVSPKDLFVAIKGEQVDGHNFVKDAVAKGASIALVERFLPEVKVPQIIVKNAVTALGQIAHAARLKTKAKVIGITGTSGKTTVKQTLAKVLSQKGLTKASPGNLNTQIGLPCSLLSCSGDEDFWVMECGISHVGDMDALGEILEPDLALILNIGPGHTEGLGDLGVAWHKTRLLNHLAPQGQGVVSADYKELVWKAIGTHCERLTFFSAHAGVSGESSYTATYLGHETIDQGRYLLNLPSGSFEVVAPFVGEYGAENCIAVACCANLLGLDNSAIKRGLREVELPSQRFNRQHLGAFEIIDDTYNANPLSMMRMLQAAYVADKPFITVLGEMRELGQDSAKLHEELGKALGKLKPLVIFWKGEYLDQVKAGLLKSAYQGQILPLNSLEKWAEDLKALFNNTFLDMQKGGTVIFKGSRANALEQYVPVLKEILATKE